MKRFSDSRDACGKAAFRLIGTCALMMFLFANPLVLRPRFWNASVVARSLTIDATLLLVGMGLICLRKWAALLSSALASYTVFLFSTGQSTNIEWGLPFLLPLVLTIVFWRSLVWGDRRRDPLVVLAAVMTSALIHFVAFVVRP